MSRRHDFNPFWFIELKLFVYVERLISSQTLHKVSKHWKCHRQYGVNIGGLSALIYVMSRTDSVDFSTKKDRLAQNQTNEI